MNVAPCATNDRLAIGAVEIHALDGTVVLPRSAHVGPVDVSRTDIDCDAIGPVAFARDDLLVRTVGIERKDATSSQIEEKKSRDGALVGGLCRFGLAFCAALIGFAFCSDGCLFEPRVAPGGAEQVHAIDALQATKKRPALRFCVRPGRCRWRADCRSALG